MNGERWVRGDWIPNLSLKPKLFQLVMALIEHTCYITDLPSISWMSVNRMSPKLQAIPNSSNSGQ